MNDSTGIDFKDYNVQIFNNFNNRRCGIINDKIREEIGKQCQLCHKRKESHMYPQKIKDKWLRLCKECWNKKDGE